VSPIKANKQIEVPLGVWTQVEPRIRSGLDPPRGKGAILGDISRPTAKYREYPCTQSIKSTLFGRWQQRCGLSLPVLQQLVKESYSIISSVACHESSRSRYLQVHKQDLICTDGRQYNKAKQNVFFKSKNKINYTYTMYFCTG